MNNLKAKNESIQYRKGEDLKEAKEIAERMKTITVKIEVKAGDNGKLFGAVTAKEIAESLKNDYKIDVDKKKILLKNLIIQPKQENNEKEKDICCFPIYYINVDGTSGYTAFNLFNRVFI